MYKDTIFRMLYRDKAESVIIVQCGEWTESYTDPEKLQVVTLENAIYMGMKNDLAFIMDMNLYLYEHQSTYNPNIPLRNLFYIADEYQRLSGSEIIIFNCDTEDTDAKIYQCFTMEQREVEDCSEFRLSSAYENATENPDSGVKSDYAECE